MSKEEQRVIMKFLVKLEGGGGNILKKLHMIYEDGALKATVVYKWVARYEGEESLKDKPRSGRPMLPHNNENVKNIDELLATNWRISNHYTAKLWRLIKKQHN